MHHEHGINKVLYPDDHEALLGSCGGEYMKLYDDSHIKQAASDVFTKEALARYAPDKDHFMMHIIALGDYERYGFNRNGDAFTKQACRDYHHTFVKYGHFYREHANRDPRKKQGDIVASAYNEPQGRVELIIHGHKKKAAHAYELAKQGKQISGSMSCKVPVDQCSCCENEAPSVKQYCGHLKYSMCQYLPEFRKYAFAFNPKPKFFDYSEVANPADRIAHYLEYKFGADELKKAAGVNQTISSTEWAEYEGLLLPEEEVERVKFASDKRLLLQRFADEEGWLNSGDTLSHKSAFAKMAGQHLFAEQLDDASIAKLRTIRPGTLFRGLAKRAAVLPFLTFVSYVNGTSMEETINDPLVKQAAVIHLPSVFGNLLSEGDSDMGNILRCSGHDIAGYDTGCDDEVQKIMDAAGEKFRVETEPASQRIIQITIRQTTVNKPKCDDMSKSAALGGAKQLAEAYGQYVAGALLDYTELTGNDVPDDTLTMLAAANRNIFS